MESPELECGEIFRHIVVVHFLYCAAFKAYQMEVSVFGQLISRLIFIQKMFAEDIAFAEKFKSIVDCGSRHVIVVFDIFIEFIDIEMHLLLKSLIKNHKPLRGLPHLFRFDEIGEILFEPVSQGLVHAILFH